MSISYKGLIYRCIILAALLVCLIALPRHYESKAGTSRDEPDKAMSKAADELLHANSKSEPQLAVSQADNRYKHKNEGRIEEIKDYSKLLSLISFGIILAILWLSWVVLKTVYREVDKLNREKALDP